MNKFVHYGLVLFVIASICAGGLSVANSQTAPIIKERAKAMESEARSLVITDATEFREDEKVEAEGLTFIPAYKDTEKVGYVVAVTGNGYGGDINMMLGIDLEGKVAGLNIISAQETPGLGDKIFGKEWQEMWEGRSKDYVFDKGTDAFAGATISPMGVYTAVTKTLALYSEKVMN